MNVVYLAICYIFPLLLFVGSILRRKDKPLEYKLVFVSYFLAVSSLAFLFIYYDGTLTNVYDVLERVVLPSLAIFFITLSCSAYYILGKN